MSKIYFKGYIQVFNLFLNGKNREHDTFYSVISLTFFIIFVSTSEHISLMGINDYDWYY